MAGWRAIKSLCQRHRPPGMHLCGFGAVPRPALHGARAGRPNGLTDTAARAGPAPFRSGHFLGPDACPDVEK